jgi:hypothetical protein
MEVSMSYKWNPYASMEDNEDRRRTVEAQEARNRMNAVELDIATTLFGADAVIEVPDDDSDNAFYRDGE